MANQHVPQVRCRVVLTGQLLDRMSRRRVQAAGARADKCPHLHRPRVALALLQAVVTMKNAILTALLFVSVTAAGTGCKKKKDGEEAKPSPTAVDTKPATPPPAPAP